MNATDWLNYFQAQGGKPEERKADWLDSAGTVLGAGIGFLAGGPPGAMAGASLGGAAGGAAENAANGGVTLQDLMRLGMAGGSMAMPFNMGGNYALGGMVNDPMFQQAAFGPPANAQQGPAIRSPQDVAEFMRGMEEAINGMPGSTFTPEQPKHPTLEMLASVVPQVVSALPKPRETKSVNKTIGAWLPAASTAFAGPINYGKAQRDERNKKGSEAAKALADHRWSIAKSMTDALDTPRMGAAAPKATPERYTLPDGTTIPLTPGVASVVAKKGLGMAPSAKTGAAKPEVTPLTPEAVDQAAWEFAMTGVMPTFGRGPTGDNQRTIIRNRTAEMFPGISISENRASFSSNRSSLTGLQKMQDAVTAFEQTAINNAKIADEAMRATKDMGSRWLNKPVRGLLEATGDPNVSALRAAIATIQPEFARILANPTLAGQLTDTSRKEMQDVISGDATLAQLRSVVTVLKRDAHNRRVSLDARIGAVRGRIRTGSVDASVDAPASAPAGRKRVIGPNGESGTVPDGTSLPAGWRFADGN